MQLVQVMPQFQSIFMLFVAILFDWLLSLFQGHLNLLESQNLILLTGLKYLF